MCSDVRPAKGEAPQRGGEVIAEAGKGRYVYTSYAWFRQRRAGVPGAYRQCANLISLPRAFHPVIRRSGVIGSEIVMKAMVQVPV